MANQPKEPLTSKVDHVISTNIRVNTTAEWLEGNVGKQAGGENRIN
jgi:hypothetical protein